MVEHRPDPPEPQHLIGLSLAAWRRRGDNLVLIIVLFGAFLFNTYWFLEERGAKMQLTDQLSALAAERRQDREDRRAEHRELLDQLRRLVEKRR